MTQSFTASIIKEATFIAGDFTLFVGESLRTLSRLRRRMGLFYNNVRQSV